LFWPFLKAPVRRAGGYTVHSAAAAMVIRPLLIITWCCLLGSLRLSHFNLLLLRERSFNRLICSLFLTGSLSLLCFNFIFFVNLEQSPDITVL
jgi:hypothetical protein